jgi:hypothetical protein
VKTEARVIVAVKFVSSHSHFSLSSGKKDKHHKNNNNHTTMSSSSKNSAASATEKKQPARTCAFRVVSESHPSGQAGCSYYGQDLDEDYMEACTTTKLVGEYDTRQQAIRDAKEERDSTCQFQDWAEDYYEDDAPPYFSSDGENPDEDETIHICIVEITKEVTSEEATTVETEKQLQKAR